MPLEEYEKLKSKQPKFVFLNGFVCGAMFVAFFVYFILIVAQYEAGLI